jgi:hypothetical protein
MPPHVSTRMSGYQKPILDFGDALNLNVSEDVSPVVPEAPRQFSEPQSFKCRDEAEEFLASTRP